MAEESSIVDQPPMTSPLLSESVYLCDHSAESLAKLSKLKSLAKDSCEYDVAYIVRVSDLSRPG